MLFYEKGDLLSSNVGIVAHGCNCAGGFGSGVAGQIAKKWPNVRAKYFEYHNKDGWLLGDVQFVALYDHRSAPTTNITRWVANCATQQEYYPRNKVHADYDAIKTCMLAVKEFAKISNLTIGIPKIGAGLAGGDWKTIENILKDVFDDYDVTVYILE